MTKQYEKTRQDGAPAMPSPEAIAALKAEAQRLRAEAIGGAIRRAIHGPRAKAPTGGTVEVPVQGGWYAPVIRSVLNRFAHQLDKTRKVKAANRDASDQAA